MPTGFVLLRLFHSSSNVEQRREKNIQAILKLKKFNPSSTISFRLFSSRLTDQTTNNQTQRPTETHHLRLLLLLLLLLLHLEMRISSLFCLLNTRWHLTYHWTDKTKIFARDVILIHSPFVKETFSTLFHQIKSNQIQDEEKAKNLSLSLSSCCRRRCRCWLVRWCFHCWTIWREDKY